MLEEFKKLDRFSKDIMSDLFEKKHVIETELDEKLIKEYNEKELQFLEEAYIIIQSGLKLVDREKNEVISKTLMENKVKLLNKRKAIIDEVFINAKRKLYEYTKSDIYLKDLIQKISEHKTFVGQGEYVIYLGHNDESLLEKIKEQFPSDQVLLENRVIEMIGGCKLHNKTINIYIDDSIIKKLEEEEENFLQYCGIEIEDKVGD